nr:hypothetical protein [Amycolatopsis xylanica]
MGRNRTPVLHLEYLPAAGGVEGEFWTELGLVPTGGGSVSFKVTGSPAELTRAEIVAATAGDAQTHNLVSHEPDGRTVVRCWQSGKDLRRLLFDLLDVNERLAEAGFADALIHTTVDFNESGGRRGRKLVLVYLPRRGTFYPFVPAGRRSRDREVELRARGLLRRFVPIEAGLELCVPV